jgi:hypothetical protein
MKASTERKIIRWLHIVIAIPLIRHLYGPPFTGEAQLFFLRWVMFPILILSGLWLWKGHLVKKRLKGKKQVTIGTQQLQR